MACKWRAPGPHDQSREFKGPPRRDEVSLAQSAPSYSILARLGLASS